MPSRILTAVRRRCRYTLPGCWVALIFGCLAFTPSLLPRPALFQGTVTGIDAAIGYGLGVLGAWIWREFADRAPRSPSSRSWRILFWAGGAALVASLIQGQWWQRQAHELVDTSPENWAAVPLIPIVAFVLFVVLVAVAPSGQGIAGCPSGSRVTWVPGRHGLWVWYHWSS